MDCHRLFIVDHLLVALAAACRTAPLERDDYLQTMREALCVLCSGWQGTNDELVEACRSHAEQHRWREQHRLRRCTDLTDDVVAAAAPGRTLAAQRKARQRDGGATTSEGYTLSLADLDALASADWQAVTRNLQERNIISGATARTILLDLDSLPRWAQPVARAILCSFSMAELRRAGYSRTTIEAVRDMLQRLGMAYHLQTV